MNPQISRSAFDTFFALAPWAIGILIYLTFFVAKRHEGVTSPVSIGQTYACANCGRRGPGEQMVAQEHGGAVSWYCGHCAAAH